MAKVIMIQGTMSNAGKSFVAAGLCRVFHQDGYCVAPFKSQNMALNSFVTKEGLEMGRAQVMQAEAAGMEPSADMNPILLKPTSDVGSQVIVNGKARGNMDARAYFNYKKELIPDIRAAFSRLSKKADIIVVEGAGSPAEINLKENDIVNMGLAEILGAPVLLVGNIDPGGVFAQLVGTVDLLEPEERKRIKGFVINQFRGDPSLLTPGIDMLTKRTGIPTLGVLPYIRISLDDEDSLSRRLDNAGYKAVAGNRDIDLAVIHLPHISNFTDFDVFDMVRDCRIRYITSPRELAGADMVILPGTKNTIADLNWLWKSGLGDAIRDYAKKGGPVWGICGGYQMMGLSVADPDHVETESENGAEGLGLLPLETTLRRTKVLSQVTGEFSGDAGGEDAGSASGIFRDLSGMAIRGYEIHMGTSVVQPAAVSDAGKTAAGDAVRPFVRIHEESSGEEKEDGLALGSVCGSYVHGIFDADGVAEKLIQILQEERRKKTAAARGTNPSEGISAQRKSGRTVSYQEFRESQYDLLADMIRRNMDMDAVYGCLEEAAVT